jgi:hypothetical protein
MPNKTLQIEIDDFFKEFVKNVDSYDKTAFSKARLKVSPEVFRELNRMWLQDIYNEEKGIKLFQDLRIWSIDGTVLELPNMGIPQDIQQSKNIKKIYGGFPTQSKEFQAISRSSMLYDLENKFVLDGILGSYQTSERFMAVEHLKALIEHNKTIEVKYKDLVIYDRGYPSYGLIKIHDENKIDFLIRSNGKNTFKAVSEFYKSDKVDEILEIEFSRQMLHKLKKLDYQNIDTSYWKVGDKIKIRAIKVPLSSGETELLLTSLLSKEKYPQEIFKELYFKRWGIEKAFDKFKNDIKIENFTGLTQIAINQDFFAQILTSNLIFSVLQYLIEDKVKRYNGKKKRKYQYQLNQKFAIGKLHNKLVAMLLNNGNIDKIIKTIEKSLLKNLVPIKPNRKFKRKESTSKFPVSKKDSF